MLGEEDALDEAGSNEVDLTGGLQEEGKEAEASPNKQSGDTPTSGKVRFQNDVGGGAGGSSDESISVESVTHNAVSASAADSPNAPSEAGERG